MRRPRLYTAKKTSTLLLGFFVVSVCLFSIGLNISFIYQQYESTRVVSVPDGDSLQLRDGRRIRLLGIDAPEKGRCSAEESQTLLSGLAKNQRVRLMDKTVDDYGRILASVYVGNAFLNQAMIVSGMARHTGSNTQAKEILSQAQATAQKRTLGIWSTACRGVLPVGECAIKGNSRGGEKQYYPSDCKTYEQVIVDTSFGDMWFCTPQEAETSGFTLAKSCL